MIHTRTESLLRYLGGIISLYKPPQVAITHIKKIIKNVLSEELSNLDSREPGNYLGTSSEISVDARQSYADNVLCVGPRYQPYDISTAFTSPLTTIMSGVSIVGINKGVKVINKINKCHFTKCFQIKGILGQATNEFHIYSKVIARAKFEHIRRHHMERILASYQSCNQRRLFETYNVDITSEEAYNLAVQGLYRPTEKAGTVMYSLQVVTFEPPNFTLEVQCINEKEEDFFNLIHNLGVSLKCLATCAGIRCIRHGCFHIEDSILLKNLTLQNVLKNMNHCFVVLEKNFPDTVEHRPTVPVAGTSAVNS